MAQKKASEKSNLGTTGDGSLEERKARALQVALRAIEKQFGKGSIMTSDSSAVPGVEFFSSQCLGIDIALGGGWAKGRIIEVYGPESSGKTTLTLHAVAEIQKTGGNAAFVDAEHSLDPAYAESLGIDMKTLLVSQPQSGEQALGIVEYLVRSQALDLIVIDSVAALVPRSEIEGEMGDSSMGVQSRLMSQAMRKLAGISHTSNCSIMFINQIRMKIGVMFGSPETTSGGNALKFYASQRVDIRRIAGIKDGEELVANRTRVKIVKNKVAPPFKEHEFNIVYGEGIDILTDMIEIASDKGVINKSGSWYSYGDARIGQGLKQAKLFLKQNPEVLEEIRTQI